MSESDEKVPDPELARWIEDQGAGQRELIVEARTPRRRITYKRTRGQLRPAGVEGGSSDERDTVLDDLTRFLEQDLELKATILRSAGCAVVSADSSQAEQIRRHSVVRAIRLNRKLR